MSTINDNVTGTVRKSRNLRGLYDHARRVARRDAIPLCISVERVEVHKLHNQPHDAHVTVYYRGGDVGQSLFASYGIACHWGETFATRRGGDFSKRD